MKASILILLFGIAGIIQANIPQIVNYRGRVVDSSGAPLDTTVVITFRIYDAPTSGSLLWEETHPAVSVENGLFSVGLGSRDPVNNGVGPDVFDGPQSRYLAIQIGADPEISPRTQFTASPYAHLADRSYVSMNALTADQAREVFPDAIT